jgi:hypothetical protein
LYIIFYPFILLFWHIPVFIVEQKSWNLSFAIINSIISYFRSFKYNFISGSVYLVCLAIICSISNQSFLWGCIFSVFFILSICYVRRFIYVFKPSSIFQVHAKFFAGIRKQGNATFALADEIKNLPLEKLTQQQLEKRTSNLQMSVLFNRICLFVAKKLKNYQGSGFNIISYVLTLLGLILLTVITFTFIYYALYKINPFWFHINTEPRFFYFLYFSFNNLLFNSISEVNVAAPVTQSAYMIQQIFSFSLGAIFVSLFFSIKHQRHSDELNVVIENIEKEGESMESFIREEYKLKSIDEAIAELEKLKSSFVKIIYQISKYIQ